MKILLVEDDKHLMQSLTKGLKEEGFDVEVIDDGYKARTLILNKTYDVFIFDIMLPGLTGLQLCELLRFKKIKTPVLMLSALSEAEDKVKALEIGADDYLGKPFHFQELVARIKALNRRNNSYLNQESSVLFCGDLKLNFAKNKVNRQNTNIELSSKEFSLLKTLMENKGNVVSRNQILQKVWQTNQDTYTNVIDVYISYLRAKIDANFSQKLIKTIKGRGYMIDDK